MNIEPLHHFLFAPRNGGPTKGFITPARVLVGFCTTNHDAVIMEGMLYVDTPPLPNPVC